MVKKLFNLLLIVSMLAVFAPAVAAAPPAQGGGQDYVVVKDDWLSKLADKYLGNKLSYPAIMSLTNDKAAKDSSYAKIANPDQIEVGWKLYIPSGDEATAFMAKYSPTAAGGKKLLIAGVVFQSDTFMQTVQSGIQAAADKAGAEVLMGNTENKLDKEASMIDDYITRKVDAIVITPISADGSLAALKKAKAAGITIICFNTCVSEKGVASAFLVTKNEDLGTKTGEAAVKFITDKLGGKATIGMLNCDQFEGCPPRKTGFQAQMKTLPGAQIVADQAGWLADKAQPVAEAMLQANPNINVLWAANEGGTVAEANAVKTLGLAGKVFVFGTDMNNQMGQMLLASDNILQGVTGQAPYQMGYDSLNAALDVLGGKTVPETTNTPTIFFGRGNDAMINQYMSTEGKAIFK
jgi:ABC-type sugar transport system substrate-binding protein